MPGAFLAALRQGTAVGVLYGTCDWLAAGVHRTPWQIVVLILAAGLIGGLGAGLLAGILRRPSLAAAFLLTGALALQQAAILSRELGPAGSATWWRGLAAAVVGASMLFLLARHYLGRDVPPGRPTLVLWCASVPGASLCWGLASGGEGGFAGSCLLPAAVVLLATGLGRGTRSAGVPGWLGVTVVLGAMSTAVWWKETPDRRWSPPLARWRPAPRLLS